MNATDGPVQAICVNPELDPRFGSKRGPVPVLRRSNADPKGQYPKITTLLKTSSIYM